jgi:hypothetical protein
MNLYQQLQSFYSDVHKCVKGRGRGRTRLAWEIIELALESTQDGGTQFSLELDENETASVDSVRLEQILEKYGMNSLTVESFDTATKGDE